MQQAIQTWQSACRFRRQQLACPPRRLTSPCPLHLRHAAGAIWRCPASASPAPTPPPPQEQGRRECMVYRYLHTYNSDIICMDGIHILVFINTPCMCVGKYVHVCSCMYVHRLYTFEHSISVSKYLCMYRRVHMSDRM